MTNPISGNLTITSNYGPRKDPFTGAVKVHSGVDFRAATGTPVFAVVSGVVERTYFDSVGGNMLTLKGSDGYRYIYAHLSKFEAKPGQTVSQGQRIALVGATGKVTGSHLHFGVKDSNNQFINPMSVLSKTTLSHPTAPQPSEFVVKRGGYRSQVIQEIINANIWAGTWRSNIDKFNELNPVTPPGGWRPGNVVKIKSQTATPASPTIDSVSKDIEKIAEEQRKKEGLLIEQNKALELKKTELENAVKEAQNKLNEISITQPAEEPKEAEEVIEISFDKINLKDWQKEALLEAFEDFKQDPMWIRVRAWWDSRRKWVRYSLTVLVAVLLQLGGYYLVKNQLPDLEVFGFMVTGSSSTSFLINLMKIWGNKIGEYYLNSESKA